MALILMVNLWSRMVSDLLKEQMLDKFLVINFLNAGNENISFKFRINVSYFLQNFRSYVWSVLFIIILYTA